MVTLQVGTVPEQAPVQLTKLSPARRHRGKRHRCFWVNFAEQLFPQLI